MKSRVLRITIASVQLAGLLLFSASAPLAHLHRDGGVQSHRHQGEGEHASRHEIIFHAHLGGHSHDPGDPHSEGEREREREDDALSISHGRLDSPRVERSFWPLVAIAYTVELSTPSNESLALAGAGFDIYRPPPLLFRQPARAPPSFY